MNNLKIKSIQIFDSIVFFDCILDKIEQRISFHFILHEKNILLQYNSTNQLLSFYKFNNLSIESFLLQLIGNTLKEKNIVVKEEDIPF